MNNEFVLIISELEYSTDFGVLSKWTNWSKLIVYHRSAMIINRIYKPVINNTGDKFSSSTFLDFFSDNTL